MAENTTGTPSFARRGTLAFGQLGQAARLDAGYGTVEAPEAAGDSLSPSSKRRMLDRRQTFTEGEIQHPSKYQTWTIEQDEDTMSDSSLVINMLCDISPAGVLPLAFGMSGTGYIPSVLLLLVFASAAAYMMFLVARTIEIAGVKSYDRLWERCIGSDSKWMPTVVLWLVCFGNALAYICMVGDLISMCLPGFGINFLPRSYCIAVLAMFPLLPLCMLSGYLDEVHALNAMGRGGLNLNPAAYRELRQQKLKGKGKGGKGKGKGKTKGKFLKKKKLKKQSEEAASAAKDTKEAEDEEDEEELFWEPNWNTLGPMEEVKEKGDINRLGRKREKVGKDDCGFGVILNRAPAMRSKKSAEAEAGSDDEWALGQSRKARAQRRRRQRKLLAIQNGEVEPPPSKRPALEDVPPESTLALDGAQKTAAKGKAKKGRKKHRTLQVKAKRKKSSD